MRTLLASFLGAAFLVLACLLSWPILRPIALAQLRAPAPLMQASVKVFVGSAHGSGIHIGNGDILTAAHVVGAMKVVSIVFESGTRVNGVTVVWADPKLDVALLHVDPAAFASNEVAPLDCSPNFPGQLLTAVGSPWNTDFVYTRIEVVGEARQYAIWETVVPVDGAVVYGQSGGGAIDEHGNTVGIVVGLMATDWGIAAFGYIVPAERICERMLE